MLASPQPMFMAWGPGAHLALQRRLHPDPRRQASGRARPARARRRLARGARIAAADVRPRIYGRAGAHAGVELRLDRHGTLEDAYFAFSYIPARDETGSVAGLFGACIETTDRVLAERRQVAAQARQQRMFEQAPSFMCILRGPAHVFEFVNNAHRKLFNSDNWIGKPVREAFPDLANQGYYELLDQVYASGERYVATSAPVRYRRLPERPEEERLLDFIYEPMTDDAGRVTGIFCEGFDVTEARRSERAFRQSEEQLRLATEAAEIGLWDFDTVTDALYWPPRVKRMFGISADARRFDG